LKILLNHEDEDAESLVKCLLLAAHSTEAHRNATIEEFNSIDQ